MYINVIFTIYSLNFTFDNLYHVPGINRRVLYAIHESEGIFTIDAKSGIISLNRELDREQQHKYNLSLYAYDQVIIVSVHFCRAA